MLLLMVFTMNILSAQERTITGIVVDGTMDDGRRSAAWCNHLCD